MTRHPEHDPDERPAAGRPPDYVIDLTQLYNLLRGQPESDTAAPDADRTRRREPEPDLEAEP